MEHPFQHTLFVTGHTSKPGHYEEHNQETKIPGKNAWVSTFTEQKGTNLNQMVRVSANTQADLPPMKEKINRELLQLLNLAQQQPTYMLVPTSDLILL